MGGFGAIMGIAPTTGEDLTFDFGFIGENPALHDGATQRFVDTIALQLSSLNVRLARTLLRSSNSCSLLSKRKIRRMNNSSERLYEGVWIDIWTNIKFSFEPGCVGVHDNSVVKDRILSNISKLNRINVRLTDCMYETGKVRSGDRVRKRFKRKLRQLRKELRAKDAVPDQVQCGV